MLEGANRLHLPMIQGEIFKKSGAGILSLSDSDTVALKKKIKNKHDAV